MTPEALYKIYLQHPVVQTDTRRLTPGSLFFALSGENFNGNSFALAALEAGAAYAVVDEDVDSSNEQLIVVDNVLDTLQQLAKYHRQQFKIPFIAVTGSNGKTTTKELIHAVLSSTYKTYTTTGNLNNHIGVPLTLLAIKSDAEMAIVEMGANHQKEIESYCAYTLPTHGLITNCGKAHLEGFGGVEGVRKGKGELFDFLRSNQGEAFVFNDYDYLQQMSMGLKTFTYGTKEAEVTGNILASDPFVKVAISQPFQQHIQTQLVGGYNLPNILSAVAIGCYFNVQPANIVQALEGYVPENSRSQMTVRGSNQIILDAYNANPSSMVEAIKNMAAIKADKKILLLGAMKELGPESIHEHQELVNFISQFNWHSVVLVGDHFQRVDHPYTYFNTVAEAREWYLSQSFHHTFQLIKGSRSIQMEKILD